MNKIKIYLDTSVISHLEAKETPEKTPLSYGRS